LRYQRADLAGAAADLQHYLEFEPAAPDAEAIRKQLELIAQLHERRN
jgi:regulator of sirC expression with transglutaminase-like and TPR domain